MRVKKYYKLVRVDYEDSAYFRIKNISNTTGTFSVTLNAESTTYPSMEYSIDGSTWTTYDFTTHPDVVVAAGANIYLRGDNPNGFQNALGNINKYIKFSMNVSHSLGGCIMSLRSKNSPESVTTISSVDFQHLFGGDVNLVYADFNFGNATTISNGPQSGYGALNGMFSGCTALVTAPDLSSVTSVGDYGLAYAFQNCTALVTPPDLSNVTTIGQQGLKYLFSGCTALVTAPDLSNVTTIGQQGLDGAFRWCTSLVTAPDLSNVTSIGEEGLHNAFLNCTSLVTAPDLSSVTSVGNWGLQGAFSDCSKLSTATAPNVQDLTVNNILQNWLYNAGTQSTGTKTVRVPTGATITTGSASGIPTGWTRVDY